MSLRIIKAKPNPAGKDRLGLLTTPLAQLAGEWVDVQNITTKTVNLNGVQLFHIAYNRNSYRYEWRVVIEFNGFLESGKIVRIHSGREIPLAQLASIDIAGANYHIFTKKDYVWNNAMSDQPSLWYYPGKWWVDQTSYDPYPKEGKILIRVNDKLI